MATIRKPFQGVWNVIRFNWHFYVIALFTFILIMLILPLLPSSLKTLAIIALSLSILTIVVSILITFYIYDTSNLYDLNWLVEKKRRANVVSITAGFDEISESIKNAIPKTDLMVLDFYNPSKHTEFSIKRARKAYPPYKNTLAIDSAKIPLDSNSIDLVISFLSVHEIRDEDERILFFKEQNRILKPGGEIIVIEHIRDFANFFAYTVGFFHFHSRSIWLKTFEHANLMIKGEEKITPFITKFTLIDGSSN